MKKRITPLKVSCLLGCFVLCLVNVGHGIGISPARWTLDVLENGGLDTHKSYELSPPSSKQYSTFNIQQPAGLDVEITGWSDSPGIARLNESSLLIDWNLVETPSVTASINVQTPNPWQTTVEPGGDKYLGSLVSHNEVADPDSGIGATASVISQIQFWRNYAPRIDLVDLHEPTSMVEPANLVLEFEDKSPAWNSKHANNPWFSYDIDWESDGVIDQIGTATFDEAPIPHTTYPDISTWTAGIQTATLSLDHAYGVSGDYLATVNVTDYRLGETTSMQVPITVVPEPATLLLLGLGGVLSGNRKSTE